MENQNRGITPGKPPIGASIVNNAPSSAHAAVDSVAGAADAAVRTAKPLIDNAATKVHQAVDKAADAVAPAAEWLGEQRDNLVVAQKKFVSGAATYVSANPLKAIGMAVAAGFLITRIVL